MTPYTLVQLFLDYGAHNNDDFLCHYGFAVVGNPHDTVALFSDTAAAVAWLLDRGGQASGTCFPLYCPCFWSRWSRPQQVQAVHSSLLPAALISWGADDGADVTGYSLSSGCVSAVRSAGRGIRFRISGGSEGRHRGCRRGRG